MFECVSAHSESGQPTKVAFAIFTKKTIEEYVSFIHNNLEKYAVRQMCKALKFPRSAYYKALLPILSNKEQEYQNFICG